MTTPKLGTPLSREYLAFLRAFTKDARNHIVQMTTNAQSGHPGGSLSCIDYLALLYTGIVSQKGNPVVISNGHISPAVYATLAGLGYISQEDVIAHFRKAGSPYEGHVTRHVRGVWYGTGPLGAGVSAASGIALAYKRMGKKDTVYALVGDGESQEGQVYEMMNVANKYQLDNFVVFMDYNEVQLSDGLKKIMPIHPARQWAAAGWQVIDVDGHDYQKLWKALARAETIRKKPVLILGRTIMGKGVSFMEKEGKKRHATWHGKAASHDEAANACENLTLTKKEQALLTAFKKNIRWKPAEPAFPTHGSTLPIHQGTPMVYPAQSTSDCRSAYGNALLDLAKHNDEIMVLTADLAGSVKTDGVQHAFPKRHIDVGVAEQQMVSCAGGLSIAGLIPFCSTFGAFMTSRAKDQARVNDINEVNVKMVATHCGLSVAEDGPTHQAIDDMGSMLGLLHTGVIEPADANHCDRIIRFIASHYGQYYVRMGRHKLPVLTKKNGTPFFDADYTYAYGRCDLLREGKQLTIAASGSMVSEALSAIDTHAIDADLVIISSPKQFDATLKRSLLKTKKLLTVEDHVVASGMGSQLVLWATQESIPLAQTRLLGVTAYQLSGTPKELYAAAGIDAEAIARAAKKLF